MVVQNVHTGPTFSTDPSCKTPKATKGTSKMVCANIIVTVGISTTGQQTKR